MCSADQTNFVTSKGGKIVWLTKDLRNTSSTFPIPSPIGDTPRSASISSLSGTGISLGFGFGPITAPTAFQKVLESLGGNILRRPIYVSINSGALLHSACPGSASSSSSSIGLTADEILDMAVIAGADPNVRTEIRSETYSCTLVHCIV